MFIIDCKEFHAACTQSIYRLEQRKFLSQIVEFVDEGLCVESVSITFGVGKGKKLTSIDIKLFNISSSCGW